MSIQSLDHYTLTRLSVRGNSHTFCHCAHQVRHISRADLRKDSPYLFREWTGRSWNARIERFNCFFQARSLFLQGSGLMFVHCPYPVVFSSSFQYPTKQGREELLTAAVERGPSQGARSGSKEGSSRPCATPSEAACGTSTEDHQALWEKIL